MIPLTMPCMLKLWYSWIQYSWITSSHEAESGRDEAELHPVSLPDLSIPIMITNSAIKPYSCESKTFKTNQVVWDAIRTARNQEKKFWTTEIEIYRLGTSTGPSGYRKNAKNGHRNFGLWSMVPSPCCWQPYCGCFEGSNGSEKLKFAPKNQFWSI